MKKIIVLFLTAALLIAALAGCGSKAQDADVSATGGWTIYDNEAAVLPDEVQAAFDQALEGYVGMGYTPIAYLGSQVVSGTNYMILCLGTTVTREPVTSYKVVTVYRPLSGNATVLNVADFDITALEEAENVEGLTGGWTYNTEVSALAMPDDAKEAFSGATGMLLGAGYQAIALLATQLVSGTNYAFLAKQSLSDAAGTQRLVVLTVYAPIGDAGSIINTNVLDLASFNA